MIFKNTKERRKIMKLSKYNFAFNNGENEKHILYNSMTNSLALIDNEKYGVYRKYENGEVENLDSDLIEDLYKGGFIVDNDFDELKELELRLLHGRFSSNSLGLTLAPTSDCNFRCIYCYEKDVIKPTYMTEEVQDAIINLVEQRKNTIKNLDISWYGGEPLLGLPIIERLSEKLIRLCEENGIQYSAGIITNGYLLSRKNVELLNKCKVSFYQITLDGDKETHDQRRFLKNKLGTFDKIISNLKECYDLLPTVSLRVNIDKTNSNSIDNIIEILEENHLEDKIKPYLGKVTNDNECHIDSICFTTKEFSEIDLKYIEKHQNKIDWQTKYPSIRSNFCSADCTNAYVINSDGLIYKCWNDIGYIEKSIGNIMKGERANPELYYGYMLYNPIKNEVCSRCKFLPICMGGCPNNRRKGGEENCTGYKEKLQNYLEFVVNKILDEKEKV